MTPYLCIDGVVDKEELRGLNVKDDADGEDQDQGVDDPRKAFIKEVTDDVQEELERHGTVLWLSLVGDEASDAYFGKMLVHFLNDADAEKARAAIDGRLFDGRNLVVAKLSAKTYAEASGLV